MDSNSWLWIALVAFLVFCCLPMFFMGRHSNDGNRRDDADKSQGPGDKSSLD